MAQTSLLTCDGCGQLASPAHFARRLQRLEWATRFRPVHIQSLVLSGISPEVNGAFLYSPEGPFTNEAVGLLSALEINPEGKSRETVLSEIQKRGLMLIHSLDCPLEPGTTAPAAQRLLEKQLLLVLARVRRSLKPKRVALISPETAPLLPKLLAADLGCTVFKDGNQPFSWSSPQALAALKHALGAGVAATG